MKVDGSKMIRTIKYKGETIAELPIGIDSAPLKQIDGNDNVGAFAYVINALNDFITASVFSEKKNEMPDKCASCKYEDRFGGCYLLNCMRNDTPYEEFDEEWRSARKEGRRLKYCPLKEVEEYPWERTTTQ